MEPRKYREACFTIAETAAVTRLAESMIRNWMSRIPIFFFGRKSRGRWAFSAADMIGLKIMAGLTSRGEDSNAAMNLAHRIVGQLSQEPPAELWAFVDDNDHVELCRWADYLPADYLSDVVPNYDANDPALETARRPVIAIPVGKVHADVNERAEAVY